MPSAARARSKQVGALCLVELQGSGQRLEHAGGGARDLATLEPRVILHAQPGESGDLAAPQSGDPAGTSAGKAAWSGVMRARRVVGTRAPLGGCPRPQA